MGKDTEGSDANEYTRSTKLCSERRNAESRPKLNTLIATYRMNVIWSLKTFKSKLKHEIYQLR